MNYFERWHIRQTLQAAERHRQLENFKNDPNQLALRIPYQRFWGWGPTGYDIWQKEKVDLKDGQSLQILTNQNLNHDTILLLNTNGKTANHILRQGELRPQALTSKAIHALAYKKKYNQRYIKSRIVSNNDKHKQDILDFTHQRIARLQELERFLGHRVDDVGNTVVKLTEAIHTYIGSRQTDQSSGKYIPGDFLTNAVEQDVAEAQILINALAENNGDGAWIETAGYKKIVAFIRSRILDALRQAQALNQILTHSRGTGAYFRGDLNSFIEDAVKVTRDHEQDLHNPVTRDHQLNYDDEKQVVIDSSYHTGSSRAELDDLLLAASTIVGTNEELDDPKLKGRVKTTSATKWRHWNSFFDSNPYGYSIFHSLRHFMGKVRNLLLAPFNLCETIVFGENAGFVASLYYEEPVHPDAKNHKNYYALSNRVKQRTHLSTKIGLIIHKTLSHFIWEGIVKGVFDGIREILRLRFDLATDFKKQDSTPESLLKELDAELNTINAEFKKIKDEMEFKGENTVPAPYYAQPKVSLEPYHSHGVFNGLVDGFISSVDLFGHHMFAKHPFTATASLAASASSFLAFYLTSTATMLFGKGFVDYLLGQGYIWSKETVSASLAGAFTHFKIVGAVIEGIENGPDSWLSRLTSRLVQDPAEAAAYGALTWFVGHALVYQVEVPGISETLRSHIGNPPFLSEFFGGLKVNLISYHLIAQPQKEPGAIGENYIDYCVEVYKEKRKQQGTEATDEEIATLRNNLQKMTSAQKIQDLKNSLQDKLSEMSTEEKAKLAVLLKLATHREKLRYLDPVLKAKLDYALPSYTNNAADARAIEKFLDPDKHMPRSTLRSFLGRILSYIPVIIRCALSPIAGLYAFSFASFIRPWRELSRMIWDDVTSTLYAIVRLNNKLLETIFNRLPRTFADIVVNGIYARVASYFGYHGITRNGYKASAAWDKAQENLYGQTTGAIMTGFIRANTTPHPEIGLHNAIAEKIQLNDPSARKAKQAAYCETAKNPVPDLVQKAHTTLKEVARQACKVM